MNVTVVLACKPSTAQWLAHQYGNPVTLPRSSSFKNQFLSCLEKDFVPLHKYDRKTFKSKIEVRFDRNILPKFGTSVKPSLQYHINDVIEEEIKHEAYEFIEAFNQNGRSIDEAVRLYQRARGFCDETYHFDAIRSNYFRFKCRLKKIYQSSATKYN